MHISFQTCVQIPKSCLFKIIGRWFKIILFYKQFDFYNNIIIIKKQCYCLFIKLKFNFKM